MLWFGIGTAGALANLWCVLYQRDGYTPLEILRQTFTCVVIWPAIPYVAWKERDAPLWSEVQ